MINAETIENGIDLKFRQNFKIVAGTLSEAARGPVESLWEAIRLMCQTIEVTRHVNIIVGTPPYSLKLGHGILNFLPDGTGVHYYMDQFIFLDVDKIALHHRSVQVASILEELVHTLMFVRDEEAVGRIVAAIYAKIVFVNGVYTPAP